MDNNSDFYPRSPCGERLLEQSASYNAYLISIHALLAESDAYQSGLLLGICDFYPRSPCGERPNDAINGCNPDFISIHALLAESDWLELFLYYQDNRFLSTLSLRRAAAKVHKTVGHFCAYGTNFMGISSSC